MGSTAASADARLASGTVASGFESVRNAFDAMLLSDPTFSAQVHVIWRGDVVIDLVGGPDLSADSITGVFSATKGVAATVMALLLDRGLYELDEPVATYWPEFAQAGKQDITVRDLLAHRAGMVGVAKQFLVEEFNDSSSAAAKLAASAPFWRPGSTHGYHALTIGILMEELVRRLTDSTLQSIYEKEIRAPRSIDFYLGLPESEEARFHEVLPPAPTARQLADLEQGTVPDSLSSVAFNSIGTEFVPAGGEMGPNNRHMRAAGNASINGTGSARGLAEVYSAIIGGPGVSPLLSDETIARVSQTHSYGPDRILAGFSTAFGLVYMTPHPRLEFGSYTAFGHDGAGGALAFADPLHDLAFGYIPMPMQLPGGADPKAVTLSHLVRTCIQRLAH